MTIPIGPWPAKCPSQLLRQRQGLLPAAAAMGLRCRRRKAQQQLQWGPGRWSHGANQGAQAMHLGRDDWDGEVYLRDG